MGKLIRTFAMGAALSMSTMGCSGEKSDLEKVKDLDLSELPTFDRAIEKRRLAEVNIGKSCVASIVEHDGLDEKQAAKEILKLPGAPCGLQFDDVMHSIVVMRAHTAEVNFAKDKESE